MSTLPLAPQHTAVSAASAVPEVRQRSVVRALALWPALAAGACALFGLVFLLNVHTVGDGVWFWYSNGFESGQKLYRDMHVPMQPLFIFLTVWNQRLLGTGWLASKAPAIVQDLLYCWGLYLVARRAALASYQRALLIVACFGMTIMAFYYRFDDYHITGYCLVVFSILLCLRIETGEDAARMWRTAAVLGALSGLAVANRLNDGALLLGTSAVALPVLLRRDRLRALGIFLLTASAVFLSFILLTGDTFRDWSNETIFRAAGIKGGIGHILFGPVHFPVATAIHLFNDWLLRRNLGIAWMSIAAISLGGRLLQQHRRALAWTLLGAGTLGALYSLRYTYGAQYVLATADSLTLVCYALSLLLPLRLGWLLYRGRLHTWNRREVLFLFPFGQMIAGAMTSGQSFLEAYPAIALTLLIAPFAFPRLVRVRMLRYGFVALLAILANGTLASKVVHPYYWHHFDNGTLFADRTWYGHPQYGPMYLEKGQLQMMTGMCGVMQASKDGTGDLLAMPWPYPNYFCAVPPWHGYVQTWYDTTSRATAGKLYGELASNPPQWIAYERALDSLWIHEQVFLGGVPLPHRALDDLIMERLRDGKWAVRWQQCYSGADWLLIETRPPAPGDPIDVPIPSGNFLNLCGRTAHGFLR